MKMQYGSSPGYVCMLWDLIADTIESHPETVGASEFPEVPSDPVLEAGVSRVLAEWENVVRCDHWDRQRDWYFEPGRVKRVDETSGLTLYSFARVPQARMCVGCWIANKQRLESVDAACDYCGEEAGLVEWASVAVAFLVVSFHVCSGCVSRLGGDRDEVE